jgi:hypothetical protein
MNRIVLQAAFFIARAIALSLILVVTASTGPAAARTQRSFATPEEAASAFAGAARANDEKALLDILGRSAKRLISSGDPVQDRNVRARFTASYDAKHAIHRRGDNRATLVVGDNDWPLPIPIVRSGERWSFDSTAGADELVSRRIGKNELLTIRTLLGGVEAQKDYFARHKAGAGAGAYAQRIISTPGRTDGLYWDVDRGQPPSPLGPLVDQVRDEGYPGAQTSGGKQLPYQGYFFRILKAQGGNAAGGAKDYVRDGLMTEGFAMLAWPAEYGTSGIMTFLVDQDGGVFQRDLGPTTARVASAITRFDQDLSWTIVNVGGE